jgi:hypothetical protein
MTKQKTAAFVVSFPLPEGATVAEARGYVEEAVQIWRGQCRPAGADGNNDDPGDPMWGLDDSRVRVVNLRHVLGRMRNSAGLDVRGLLPHTIWGLLR